MKSIIDRILAMARGRAESAEVIAYEGDETPVEFTTNKLHQVEHKEVRGVGLRVIKGGRLGFSSTTDLSKLDELVDHALESAAFGQQSKFEFPQSCSGIKVKTADAKVKAFTAEAAIDEGKQALARLREKAPELKCDITLNKRAATIELANSRGLYATYDKTSFSYLISGVTIADGSLLFLSDYRFDGRLRLETAAMVGQIAKLLKAAKRTAKVVTGRMPVLFTVDAMGIFWSAIGMGVNGKMVQKKSSPLVGKLGQRLLDPRITIHDDPGRELAVGSAPYDGEGVCCRKLPLFEKGMLKNYLFDLQTAGLLGATSNGRAQRGFSSQPYPGTTNLVVKPGGKPLKDILAGMDRGLVVYDLVGAGQSNILAGDFSANIGLGFKVEKGKLVGRVKDAMVAGNVYDLLRGNVQALSAEVDDRGDVFAPAILFGDVSVAAK